MRRPFTFLSFIVLLCLFSIFITSLGQNGSPCHLKHLSLTSNFVQVVDQQESPSKVCTPNADLFADQKDGEMSYYMRLNGQCGPYPNFNKCNGTDNFVMRYFNSNEDGSIRIRMNVDGHKNPNGAHLGIGIFPNLPFGGKAAGIRLSQFSQQSSGYQQCLVEQNGLYYRQSDGDMGVFEEYFPNSNYDSARRYSWMMLEKLNGNSVRASYSDDGYSWFLLRQMDFPVSTNWTIGLTLASVDDNDVFIGDIYLTGFGMGVNCPICNLFGIGSDGGHQPQCSPAYPMPKFFDKSPECGVPIQTGWAIPYDYAFRYAIPSRNYQDLGLVPDLYTYNVDSLQLYYKGGAQGLNPGSEDDQTFVFKRLEGDGNITAQIRIPTGINDGWGGIVMRELIESPSPLNQSFSVIKGPMFMCFAGQDALFQSYSRPSGGLVSFGSGVSGFPFFVRMEKKNGILNCYGSGTQVPNGATPNPVWTLIRSVPAYSSNLTFGGFAVSTTGVGRDISATFKWISFSGFKGFCSDNAESCGTKNGTLNIVNEINKCICRPDLWGGTQCEIPMCAGTLATYSTVCLARGNCTAPNQCACRDGYTGSNCEIPPCFGIPASNNTVCSGRGSCVNKDVCVCTNTTLWSGSTCQFPNCHGISGGSPSVCNGDGVCSSFDNCTCNNPDTTGPQCESFEFLWIGQANKRNNGSWTDRNNWVISTKLGIVAASRYPRGRDNVWLNSTSLNVNTGYYVDLSEIDLKVRDVKISNGAVLVIRNNSNVHVTGTLYLQNGVTGSITPVQGGLSQGVVLSTTSATSSATSTPTEGRLFLQESTLITQTVIMSSTVRISGSARWNITSGSLSGKIEAMYHSSGTPSININGFCNATSLGMSYVDNVATTNVRIWGDLTMYPGTDQKMSWAFVINVYGTFTIKRETTANLQMFFARPFSKFFNFGELKTAVGSIETNVFGDGTMYLNRDDNGNPVVNGYASLGNGVDEIRIDNAVYTSVVSAQTLNILGMVTITNLLDHRGQIYISVGQILSVSAGGSIVVTFYATLGSELVYSSDGKFQVFGTVHFIGDRTINTFVRQFNVVVNGGTLRITGAWIWMSSVAIQFVPNSNLDIVSGTVEMNHPLTFPESFGALTGQGSLILTNTTTVLGVLTTSVDITLKSAVLNVLGEFHPKGPFNQINGKFTGTGTIYLNSNAILAGQVSCKTVASVGKIILAGCDISDSVLEIAKGASVEIKVLSSAKSTRGTIIVNGLFLLNGPFECTDCIIENRGEVTQSAQLIGNGKVQNYGSFIVDATINKLTQSVFFYNYKTLEIKSGHLNLLENRYVPFQNSLFSLSGANVSSSTVLTISFGNFEGYGFITSPFTFDSNTGTMRVRDTKVLVIDGQFTLGRKGMLFIILNSRNSPILFADSAILKGLTYLKMGGAISPNIGDLYSLFSMTTNTTLQTGDIAFSGASFRTGKFVNDGLKTSVEIVSSFGEIESSKYQCQ